MYYVLIIEDDPAYCSMMELILKMEGFGVGTAPDGAAGLASIRDRRPDVILCDIMMPQMDGRSVLEALKVDQGVADIPFIFVSAMAERDQVREGMAAGADDYLPKPFSAEELLAAVTGRIRRHELIKARQPKSDFAREKAILRHGATRRELEVLHLVGQGATSREIAERLGVSQKTVEVHRANLMRKLEVTNAAGLARWAVIADHLKESD